MFWFDKQHPRAVYCDNRVVPYHEYYKGRYIEINPDVVADFTALPFPDKQFKLVVFDPPPSIQCGPSIMDDSQVRPSRRQLATDATRRLLGVHASAG